MAEFRSGEGGFDRSRNTAYQRTWRGAVSKARKAKARRAAAAFKKVKASRKKVLGKKGESRSEYMARRNKAVKRFPYRQGQ